MKCEIIGEKIVVVPDNQTEVYAMNKWLTEHPIDEIELDAMVHEDYI